MLAELLGYLKNWFSVEKLYGEYEIAGGMITTELPLQVGQHFRIIGSVFNDGVYQYTGEPLELKDETFTGSIWTLAIPQEVLDLASEISDWKKKYEGADSAALSPFNSESFGGYSYSKSSGNTNGSVGGWQSVFGNRLIRYRKV